MTNTMHNNILHLSCKHAGKFNIHFDSSVIQ